MPFSPSQMMMKLPYSFLTVGNHDLEHAATVDILRSNFSFHWGGK